jgi:hypothetical protein
LWPEAPALRYEYYLHLKGGKVFDYFGGIGHPLRVSPLRAWIWKLLGFRMTRVRKGKSLKSVILRAAIKGGAHRHSYKVEQIMKNGYDEV